MVPDPQRELVRRHWGDNNGPPVADSMRYLALKPVAELCTDPALLRVTMHRANPKGAVDGWDPVARRPYWVQWLGAQRRALTVWRICGAVLLDRPLSVELTTAARLELEPVQAALTAHYEGAAGRRNASWEMVYNPVTPGARRYHGRVPLRAPFTDPELIWPDELKEVLVGGFTGNRQLEIGRFSYVTAVCPALCAEASSSLVRWSTDAARCADQLPESGEQNWHKDVDEPYKNFNGASSFEEADQFQPDDPVVKNLPIPPPAPGALVFFALHDVPLKMGPTELTVGSHLFSSAELRRVGLGSKDERGRPMQFEHQMSLRQGDILVMDIRLLHHGTANRANKPRTLLYIQYVQDFFIDRGNFPDKQTTDWVGLASTRRGNCAKRVGERSLATGQAAQLSDAQAAESHRPPGVHSPAGAVRLPFPVPPPFADDARLPCWSDTSAPCRLLVENGVVDGEEGLQRLRATWWLTQGNTPESLST